jgi:hypothetical protein
MGMGLRAVRVATIVGIVALSAWILPTQFGSHVEVFDPPIQHIEAAPLCPWREPETDRQEFFPNATSHLAETRILSAFRVELQAQLGRQPEPEENSLLRYRILEGTHPMGWVLTRRAKGEHGAIEVVVALNTLGDVQGIALQRMREPDRIAKQLTDSAWLNRFRGRTYTQGWNTNDLDGIIPEARISAAAIREAVRSLLILQAAAEGHFR